MDQTNAENKGDYTGANSQFLRLLSLHKSYILFIVLF